MRNSHWQDNISPEKPYNQSKFVYYKEGLAICVSNRMVPYSLSLMRSQFVIFSKEKHPARRDCFSSHTNGSNPINAKNNNNRGKIRIGRRGIIAAFATGSDRDHLLTWTTFYFGDVSFFFTNGQICRTMTMNGLMLNANNINRTSCLTENNSTSFFLLKFPL